MPKRPHITETTRKNLMDSFWKLYLVKPLEKISVREITDIAGYNRGTFYLYFKDVYDVLEQTENEILEIIEKEVDRYSSAFFRNMSRNNLPEITAATINLFKSCDYKPFILLSDRGDPRFEEALKEKMQTRIEERSQLLAGMDEKTKEYTAHFMVSGVLGIIKKWYNDGMVIPVEEHIAVVCNVLFNSGIIT